jgi:hypothetical protein
VTTETILDLTELVTYYHTEKKECPLTDKFQDWIRTLPANNIPDFKCGSIKKDTSINTIKKRTVLDCIKEVYDNEFIKLQAITATVCKHSHPEQIDNEIRNALTHLSRALKEQDRIEIINQEVRRAIGHIERARRDCLKIVIANKHDEITAYIKNSKFIGIKGIRTKETAFNALKKDRITAAKLEAEGKSIEANDALKKIFKNMTMMSKELKVKYPLLRNLDERTQSYSSQFHEKKQLAPSDKISCFTNTQLFTSIYTKLYMQQFKEIKKEDNGLNFLQSFTTATKRIWRYIQIKHPQKTINILCCTISIISILIIVTTAMFITKIVM